MKTIIKMTQVTDNWGGEYVTEDPEEIADTLKEPEYWNGDIFFTDNIGNVYDIDDLIELGDILLVNNNIISLTE